MEELIKDLHQELYSMSVGYVYYHSRKAVEEVKAALPKIQEFTEWFLAGNRFGIEDGEYQELCGVLLGILNDISEAIPKGDRVLLHDAAAYGLMEFLEMFMEEDGEDGPDENL